MPEGNNKRKLWEKFRQSWLGRQGADLIDNAFQHLLWIGVVAAISFGGAISSSLVREFSNRWLVVGVTAGISILSILTIVLALVRKLRVERRTATRLAFESLRSERDTLVGELDTLQRDLLSLEAEFEQEQTGSEEARRLVSAMLSELQQEVEKGLIEIDQFIPFGVIEPLRELLLRGRKNVRVCVLEPRRDDPEVWRMRWAVGHLPSVRGNFSRRVDDTVAGTVFRHGQPLLTGNVHEDIRVPPRKSERFYKSQMVIPLKVGRRMAGVLSVVSHDVDTFGTTDLSFGQVIAGVIEVALAAEHWRDRRGTEPAAASTAGEGLQPEPGTL